MVWVQDSDIKIR